MVRCSGMRQSPRQHAVKRRPQFRLNRGVLETYSSNWPRIPTDIGQRTNPPGGTGGAVWVSCSGKTFEGRAVQWIDLAQGLPANRNCSGKFFALVGFSLPRRMLLGKRRGDSILITFGLMVQGTLVQESEVAFSGLK